MSVNINLAIEFHFHLFVWNLINVVPDKNVIDWNALFGIYKYKAGTWANSIIDSYLGKLVAVFASSWNKIGFQLLQRKIELTYSKKTGTGTLSPTLNQMYDLQIITTTHFFPDSR